MPQRPWLDPAALRIPDVDKLSALQLELLRTLRGREGVDLGDPTLPVIRSLIGLTIRGLSAALQGTGSAGSPNEVELPNRNFPTIIRSHSAMGGEHGASD
ncbi:MAG: hypothetical protein ABI555_06095 [Chloroflexota bacterium]